MKVTIDGIAIDVEPGTTILNAARQIGGDIVPPAMCYYSKLKDSGGKCRTCLVKVSKGSEKDPRPMPKLVASCRTTVMDGMEVQNITSPEVIEARKGVVRCCSSTTRWIALFATRPVSATCRTWALSMVPRKP